MSEMVQVVGSVFGYILTFAAAVLTARASMKAKRIDAEATPYETLANRTTALESQVEKLRKELFEWQNLHEDLKNERDRLVKDNVRYITYLKDLVANWHMYRERDNPPTMDHFLW